jgi:sucrose-phosphate synthase
MGTTNQRGTATPDADAPPQAAGAARGLYVQMFSLHGLIRGRDLELGRDADTGGQTKYVVELARALAARPEVELVELFTRRIDDPRVSDDYDQEVEELAPGARIVRLRAGGSRYRRKELLWPHLDAYVTEVLRWTRALGRTPDVVHAHYADAGAVAMEVARYLGAPFAFTGHSLGRNKLAVLEASGLSHAEIDARYHIDRRIDTEERLLRHADVVVASTGHEVRRGYERYAAATDARFEVIPPGIDVDRFYPYYHDLDPAFDPGESVKRARVRMRHEIGRFLNQPDKPLILAVSRPDRRKNIESLVIAYGEDKELQHIANLAVFAGVRGDIRDMSDNEREVLTELLLLMDRYDLYGRLALPKKHDPDTDIPVLYRIAAASRGVFINPALVENFGITLLESSSSGLPVVSTDHGGPQDIIGTCGSGLLIDARDTSQIQRALKDVLVDREAWDRYSRHGVDRVRQHFSWSAHVDRYLEVIEPLVAEGAIVAPRDGWRTDVGRRLQRTSGLLVSDIDHTLVAEEGPADREGLQALATSLEDAGLTFAVASGRSLELVKEVIAEHDMPVPSIVISSVGSEIDYLVGTDGQPCWLHDRGYAAYVGHEWDPDAIEAALADVAGLTPQRPEAQRAFKRSYVFEDPTVPDAVRARLDEAALRATVVVSHGRYLDALPHRAGKGHAIRYLSHKWGVAVERIAVAGDSGNDEDMLRGPFRGIVVGNHAREIGHLRGRKGIYFAKGALVTGVLEGLRHWGLVKG